MAETNTIEIPSELDLPAAQNLRQRILDCMATKGRTVRLEFDGDKPTQVGLQLLFAARIHARGNDVSVEYGPQAQSILQRADHEQETMD